MTTCLFLSLNSCRYCRMLDFNNHRYCMYVGTGAGLLLFFDTYLAISFVIFTYSTYFSHNEPCAYGALLYDILIHSVLGRSSSLS